MKPFLRRYFLEFIFAFYTLGTALYNVPINTVMNDKACSYVFHYNSSICDSLENQTSEIQGPVFAHVNTYMTARDFVMNVPGECSSTIDKGIIP